MDDNTPLTYISPACPIPLVWSPIERLQVLKDCLDPASPRYFPVEGMHPNIRACIAAYENGQMPSQGNVYFKHGRMVSQSEGENRDTLVWTEEVGVFHTQMANRQIYGRHPTMREYHMLAMEVRFRPGLGGNGLRYGIEVMNDTESDILTLFYEDVNPLGIPAIAIQWVDGECGHKNG